MVTHDRYVPPGYIDAEGAILRIAKARHPDRWRPELLHPKEAEIYAGLGAPYMSYKADFLIGYLRSEIPQADLKQNAGIAERMYDFDNAARDLRAALHAGTVTAEFVDERGEYGWIQPTGWGGDEAIEALLRGTVILEGNWRRLILLKIDAIDKLAAERANTAIDQCEASSVHQEQLIKPLEGWGSTGRSLKAALDQAFPLGVPDVPISHIRDKIGATTAFHTRGLDKAKLDRGGYDLTIRRLLRLIKR
jgi:hypothetical protein